MLDPLTAAARPAAQGLRLPDHGVSGRPWQLNPVSERDLAAFHTGVEPDVARLLLQRGIGPDLAQRHLTPKLRDWFPDPAACLNMEAGAERFLHALKQGELIGVFADYDVDGLTSAALLTNLIRHLGGPDPLTYVPDRLSEGYGPNAAAIAALVDSGARLILTVDCGAASGEAFRPALERGVDVIVLDHHPVDEAASGFMLIDPSQPGDSSGLGDVSAGGLTFLFAAQVLRQAGGDTSLLFQVLDLVALSTICDMVPARGFNRALTVQGLAVLSRLARPGLAALAESAAARPPFDTRDAGFAFGPRLNAASRMGEAGTALRLLNARDEASARPLARRLDELNRARRALQENAWQEALIQAEAVLNADPDTDVLVVASPGWTPGLVGLVAGKLAERFQKPALAFAVDEAAGVARGSGRSIEGVDLGAGVRALARSGMLLTGGGHAMAAGASLAVDALGALPELLGAHIERVAAPPLRIDAAGAVHEARRFGAAAERAGPFGPGFEEPVFALGPTRLEAVEPFGTNHVRYVAAEPGGGRLVVKHFGGAGSPAAIKARASASAHAPVWLAVSVSAGAFGGVDAHLRDLGMAREP